MVRAGSRRDSMRWRMAVGSGATNLASETIGPVGTQLVDTTPAV